MIDKTLVLEPYMPPDPLMAGPWVACLRWALSEDKAMEAFRADTGINWRPARTPIDQMTDDATGAEAEFFRAFAAWFNENVWGDINLRAGESSDEEESE